MKLADRHAEITARDWQGRWEAIVPHLPKPGIALDLGAADGAFSRSLAGMGWKVHAFDMRVSPSVVHRNVTWHRERLDAHGIAGLARRLQPNRGRFDLVLGLSVLHWMDDFAAAYWAMRWIADTIIIEVPNPEETPKKAAMFTALDQLARHEGSVIGQAPGSHTALLRTTVKVGHGAPKGTTARVHSGSGKAAALLEGPEFARVLGYRPFPGTLDHQLSGPLTLDRRRVVKAGGWRFWPVSYMGLPAHVAGHPGWLPHGPACDLVAPVSLRRAFAMEDGDLALIDFG